MLGQRLIKVDAIIYFHIFIFNLILVDDDLIDNSLSILNNIFSVLLSLV